MKHKRERVVYFSRKEAELQQEKKQSMLNICRGDRRMKSGTGQEMNHTITQQKSKLEDLHKLETTMYVCM